MAVIMPSNTVEQSFGTSRDDTLIGSNGTDIIDALAGNDVIDGRGGDDILYGNDGDDTIRGGTGDDLIIGGPGNDFVPFDPRIDGADRAQLGTGADRVDVSADAPGRVRLSFALSGVGNGNPNDPGELPNNIGTLAVSLQAAGSGDVLTGPVGRFDDEGIAFVAAVDGLTFDVRDLGFGTSRGDQFRAVVLGTAFNDVLGPVPGRESQPHYINGGESNDTITGGSGHDVLIGALGNDVIRGGTGDDAIFGGSGNDVALFNVTTDGADRTDLESGLDRVDVSADAPGQIRLTFTSSEVGDGRPVDLGGSANQDGGLAVRLQAEGPGDTLTGPVSRFDDEGITFAAAMDGLTFDVRDLVSGTPRGDRFGVVVLGSSLNDVLGRSRAARRSRTTSMAARATTRSPAAAATTSWSAAAAMISSAAATATTPSSTARATTPTWAAEAPTPWCSPRRSPTRPSGAAAPPWCSTSGTPTPASSVSSSPTRRW